MDETLFATLEKRVEALITRCNNLENTNRELEHSRDTLLAERVNLLNQRKQIAHQMGSLIDKLESTQEVAFTEAETEVL